MIEDALWERLTGRVRTQIGRETERFVDGQVSLDDEHWCARDLTLLDDNTTATI